MAQLLRHHGLELEVFSSELVIPRRKIRERLAALPALPETFVRASELWCPPQITSLKDALDFHAQHYAEFTALAGVSAVEHRFGLYKKTNTGYSSKFMSGGISNVELPKDYGLAAEVRCIAEKAQNADDVETSFIIESIRAAQRMKTALDIYHVTYPNMRLGDISLRQCVFGVVPVGAEPKTEPEWHYVDIEPYIVEG